ncbi:MAG: hypothetical protein ACXVP0_16725 [Bacteroidia bacterium]
MNTILKPALLFILGISLSFIGPGSCQVDYYENSSSITKTKHFTWN